MDWMWTWGGESFGYREGDELWTHDGKHVGHFSSDEVYGADGRYLGELGAPSRLITNRSKSGWRKNPFAPFGRRVGVVRYVNYVGNVMFVGHEDFPKPGAF
jgi:hypothetical protein